MISALKWRIILKKRKYLVDGRFLASMSTGVDRYAYQSLKELDKICKDIDISILVPSNAKEIPDYKKIKVIKSHFSKFWTQIVFAINALIRRATPVNLCNEVSIFAKKGICALHDVCYAEDVDFFPEEEKQWFLKIYKRITKHSLKIVTVSQFSKKRICELLNVPEEKIVVAGNGWQHFSDVKSDETVFDKHKDIRKGEYYFCMASANKNKNVAWVVENAKYNPDKQYVLGGKDLDVVYKLSEVKNIIFVGFLNDGHAKALMEHCKAFLFPSFYEGFGIPPLEAQSVGTQIIISDAASLPEIFKDSAHYIKPDEPHIDLNKILEEKVGSYTKILNKYSWKGTAEKIYKLLQTL